MKTLKTLFATSFLAFIIFLGYKALYPDTTDYYSPLENAIKAQLQSDSLNKVSQLSAQHFIDSLNNN